MSVSPMPPCGRGSEIFTALTGSEKPMGMTCLAPLRCRAARLGPLLRSGRFYSGSGRLDGRLPRGDSRNGTEDFQS